MPKLKAHWRSNKSLRRYWQNSVSESVLNDIRSGRARVVRAAAVTQPKVRSVKLPETTAPLADLTAKQIRAHKKAAAIPADLSIPKVLDRVEGRSKKEINAERDALIARDKKRSQLQHALLSNVGGGSKSTLTDADKKAIAELQSEATATKATKTAARISKVKAKVSGDTKKMPAQGKEAVALINQSDTPSKPSKKVARSVKSAAKADLMVSALKRKNGVNNAELAKVLGARPSAATMRKVCEVRGLKLKIVKSKDEPFRYMAV